MLCVLKPEQPLECYTAKLLTDVFEQHAKVIGLRIIERNVKLKALVEFETPAHMEFVRTNLHKTTVDKFGMFEVYASKKTSVSTQASSFQLSEVEWPSQSEWGCAAGDLLPQLMSLHSANTATSLQDITQDFGRSSRPRVFSLASLSRSCDLQIDVTPEAQPSAGKVLMLNRLDFNKINKQMIANLLGCFGNVAKVITNSESFFALVEMQTVAHAQSVLGNLTKLLFFAKPLKIKSSKYTSLSLKKMDPELNPRLDSLAIDSRQHRFSPDAPADPVAPSPILSFANLPYLITPKILYDYISIIHEPVKIKRVVSESPDNCSCLVMFANASHACDVLAVFHGKQFDNDVVSVSFTSSQI